MFLIQIRYGWFKSQKEDIRNKVVVDSLTNAETALTNLKNSFSGSLPGRPEDATNQFEIDHAQRHLNSAIAEEGAGNAESKSNQKDRVLRSIDGLDI